MFVEVDRIDRGTTRVPPEGRVCSLLMEEGGRRQNRDVEGKMLFEIDDAVLRHMKGWEEV